MSSGDVLLGGGLSIAGGVIGGAMAQGFAWWNRRAERAHELLVWQREQRRTVYVDALYLAHRISADVRGLAADPTGKLPGWQDSERLHSTFAALVALGSQTVRDAFDEYEQQLVRFWNEQRKARANEELFTEHLEAMAEGRILAELEAKVQAIHRTLSGRVTDVELALVALEGAVRAELAPNR